MIETDDRFEPVTDGWDYLVDFLDLSFPTKRPEREHFYLEVRRTAQHAGLKAKEGKSLVASL